MERWAKTREQLKRDLGDKYDRPIGPGNEQQMGWGRTLFVQLCSGCHGKKGDGTGTIAASLPQAPSNFTDPAQARFFSDEARLRIIRDGIPRTTMNSWGDILSEEDLLDVYLYIRSLLPAHGAR